MRRRLSSLCAMPLASALLLPAQAQERRGGAAQQGPIPEPVSAAANPHPLTAVAPHGKTDAEGRGRRIVSVAFVRLDPDGWMELKTRDGRRMVLRGVTMESHAVCGVTAAGRTGKRRCITYAQVTQARSAAPPARLDAVDADPGRRATERVPRQR
jgi:hypothetical protein